MAPLRILCIHGYRQNSGSFREKTGALRKLLKKSVELVFMDAPLSVQPPDTGTVSPDKESSSGTPVEADPRGWWFSDVAARSFSAQQKCEVGGFTGLACLNMVEASNPETHQWRPLLFMINPQSWTMNSL
ncbi:hypothetical protein NQD34_010235 [Periophthalmus magnuspinnatus]|nr:hypothetical protein NQD34_010235 [Periophthalmus magnuspinnatus]